MLNFTLSLSCIKFFTISASSGMLIFSIASEAKAKVNIAIASFLEIPLVLK